MKDNDNKDVDFVDLRDGEHDRPPMKEPCKMKVSAIVAICVVAVVLLAGAQLAFGFFFGGSHGNLPAGGSSFATSQVSELDLRFANRHIEVVAHGASDIRVDFVPPSWGNYTRPNYELANGRLRIYDQRGTGISILGFGNSGGGRVIVSVPADWAVISGLDAVTVRTTNGSIDVQGIAAGGSITINTTNGRINLRQITANGNLSARSTNGRVEADNINAFGDLELRTTNGALALSDSWVGGRLTARTTNGAINITNVDADIAGADIRTTNGRTTIH